MVVRSSFSGRGVWLESFRDVRNGVAVVWLMRVFIGFPRADFFQVEGNMPRNMFSVSFFFRNELLFVFNGDHLKYRLS